MKILSKIKIHFFFYIIAFIALLTGHFKDYIFFTLIIFVHELGHIIGGVLFSWRVKYIKILPIGGLTLFDIKINESILSTFIVTIMGPLFQIIFYFFLTRFFTLSPFLKYYNFILLFFNLLPIFPMDGSKILYCFLCLIFPFKLSYTILLVISFILITLLFIFTFFDFIIFLIILFLLFSNLREFINRKNIFNRFLFERYMYDFNFKKLKCVSSKSFMFLGYRHLFLIDGKSITERKYLSKMFDKHFFL